MRPSVHVLLLVLAGCAPEPDRTHSWIEPMDGFTGWPDDEPLYVVTHDLDVPPGYELRDLIRVVDLADGGQVAGTFEAWDDDRVRFDPDHDWVIGRRYAWTLDVPESVPHGPEWSIPEELGGTAVFDTDPGLEVLAAGFDADRLTCVVLSAPAQAPVLDVRFSVDDIDFGLAPLDIMPADEWNGRFVEEGLEPTTDIGCLPSDVTLEPRARLRVWFVATDETPESGPWLVEVDEADPAQLVADRYRFFPPTGTE